MQEAGGRKSYLHPASCFLLYIHAVLALLRKHPRYFFALTAAAFALRLLFIYEWPAVRGDSFIYGDIAKSWLTYGVYGFTRPGYAVPTLIRLPGYPAFLALVWQFAGIDHYNAVLLVQMFVDVGTCFVVAALALRVAGERAARIAFLLAALCPFLADYCAAALSETLTVFFTALALYLAIVALEDGRMRDWAACGVACACGILLRPDGGLVLAAIGCVLLWRLVRRPEKRQTLAAGVLVAAIALAPLVPWTIRNWRVFHVVQPLAPRYANDPGEFVAMGFNHWVKTWLIEFASVQEVYWPFESEPIDADKLPDRAFDSPEQRTATEELLDDYNDRLDATPDLDARFEALARERIAAHPLRYYVGLPALRVADMWLRPRTELLPVDVRWWEYENDPHDFAIGACFGALNLSYLVAAVVGLGRRRVRYAGLLITFVLLRTLLLATLENPEPRYTLECFPVVFVLAGAAMAGARRHSEPAVLAGEESV